MRLLKINLLAAALVLFSVGFASASSITLVPTTGTTINPGESVSFDIILDANEPGLITFGVGTWFNPDVLSYDPGNSAATSYILYTGGKGATYLVPESDPWATWAGFVPPGLEQVNIVFIENSLSAAPATGTGILLGNISFVGNNPGITQVELNFVDAGGTIYNVNGEDLEASVGVNSIEVVVIPEPTTALLVGLGMVGLGVAGRRRA